VGDGPVLGKCKKLAKELGLGKRAEFTGRVPYEEIPEIYRTMDLVLAPFVRVEPVGRVLLEAMASGRGVITTTVCGGSERISEGENGFVVRPGDVDAMADRIGHVIRDPEALGDLGKAGRLRIERDHSPKVIRKRVLAFYKRILSRRK
jgi:glycosyltransferase involved in cell wall biosynthesis